MDEALLQTGHGVRFEWGAEGARRLVTEVACLVVVDVLSFTTSVSVAVERGTRVFPFRWRDESAVTFAHQVDAKLAVGRRAASSRSPWSLSPAALRAAPEAERLVLPSPNGSAIVTRAAADGATAVVAASLRNGRAVAEWLAAHGYGTAGKPVGVIAAGERWPDDSLRPALEDLLGAGLVVDALRGRRCAPLSPEARVAADAYAHCPDVASDLHESTSGRELAEEGFREDVEIAAEVDSSDSVPVLTNSAFVDRG
ncbi:2-phosphosulfolactate phosphatase [Streptomyces sp. XM4193]|uniref:2-phosphosulfolactate phosphatase n=1 Tax=Streptomyces sp. XM4193 TaxID=2929782 RepID=UPI001FF8123A|nr:2-phosphosulfolactate phosphatase [Streptomyces sp. XM4193]MCK1796877.1 2-phosphosulfolactate phosphatase [Streptomyces sp. XM4193]